MALFESEWLYIEEHLLTDDARAALIKDVVSKAKGSGVKVALGLSGLFMAQMFADNLWDVISEGVDLVFCNKDEALAFTKTETVDQACDALKQSAKIFAVTDRAHGSIIFDGQATVIEPDAPADAVDTNGSGDVFAGAFLYVVTAGRDFKWATELANESLARVMGQFGCELDATEFDSIKQRFGI